MVHISTKRFAAVLVVPLLFCLGGCGSQDVSLTGSVTYKGKPVENATIMFISQEKQGGTVVVDIIGGKYTASGKGLVPGKIQAIITNKARPQTGKAGGEGAAPQLDPWGNPADDMIPIDAGGVQEIFEVKPGNQVKDFHLTAPKNKPESNG